MAVKTSKTNLTLGGIAITHPDRVISETGHVTKGRVAEYYASIAPFLLPEIVRRPLSLLRCPSGIDGECFFQRNPGKGLGAVQLDLAGLAQRRRRGINVIHHDPLGIEAPCLPRPQM